MKEYTVKFIIGSISAESPLEAAKRTEHWIEKGGMTFTVQDEKTKKCFSVDLSEEDADAVLPLKLKDFKNS